MSDLENKALIEKINTLLIEKEWERVEEYCDNVLNSDPHNATAYLGLLLSSLKITTIMELANIESLSDNKYYKRVMQFADNDLKELISNVVNGNYSPNNIIHNNSDSFSHNKVSNNSSFNKFFFVFLVIVALAGYYIWAYEPFYDGPRYQNAKKYALASGGRLVDEKDTWVAYQIPSINMDRIRFYFNGKSIRDNPPVAGCFIMLRPGMYISYNSMKFTRTMLEDAFVIPKNLPIRECSVYGSTCFEIGKVDHH